MRGALVLVAVALLSSTASCTTHQCDPTTIDLGGDGQPTPGWTVADGELVWQSSPVFGPWLPFPGGRTYAVTLPPLPSLPSNEWADLEAALPSPYVALVQGTADAAPANLTPATGELAQIANAAPLSFSVVNPTCAQYYLWVEVRVPVIVASDGGASSDEVASSVDANLSE
jgi:hypothetical protein